MMERKSFVFRFADIEVRECDLCIVRAGEVLTVEPKAFRVLLFLLRHPKRVITKDELLNAVWNDVAVSENSLTRSITVLRKLLGDDVREPSFIATVPTIGYRLLAEVSTAEETRDKPREIVEPPQTRTGPHRMGLVIILAGAAMMLLGAMAFFSWPHARSTRQAELVERKLTASPPDVPVTSSAISPDGKYLAYGDRKGIYIRQVEGGETHVVALPDTLPHSHVESWFPDSTHFAVSAWAFPRKGPETIWTVWVLGGTPRRLVENATSARISPNGLQVAFVRDLSGATRSGWPTAMGVMFIW